jgi:DNA-binding winged helix-turn-helix (wHTH) protein/Tfp pilus assembly protein PilF
VGASFRFGPFVADRTGYRVLREGRAIEVTPKLLDLLFHLIDHAGDLVTKEALLDALWPGANVTENALAQAVSELRQALGDDAASPRFIKTVARRGYRFIAEIEHVNAEAGSPPQGGRHREAHRQGADDRDRTIAVMDFANVSGDDDAAWLSAGIAETVTSDLRALGHFRVVDRWRVVEVARRTDGSLEQVAADLHARLTVVGSFQRTRDRIRITARVVDLATGEALADAKVDGPMDGIFALQDQVVAQFASELEPGRAHDARAARRDTASLNAYRAFSEGWLRLESLDVREMPAAIADFERAVAADPRYALALTGLASAEFAYYETTRADNEPAHDLLERAIGHARRAVELDDTLAEAHATLALLLVSAWRTTEAAEAARRAVALEPSNWRHLFRLGHATWGDERLRAATGTLALYPDFAFAHFQMAMVYVARRDLAQAETVLRQGAAVQDRQIGRGGRYPALGLHWLLGLVRLAEGDVDEALGELDREHRLAEPHRLYGREYAMHALHGRGAALVRGGRTAEAAASFERALELYPDYAPSRLGLALARGSRDFSRVEASLATLSRTKPIESAIVRSQLLAAQGDARSAAEALTAALVPAPAGFAGWTIAIEPFLSQPASSQPFTAVFRLLADRAA